MRILIVEDEQKSALDLATTLLELRTDIEITAVLESVETAIDCLLHQPQPDIAFLDVQLADGLSFEIFSEVDVKCPIIFCTAFDENAITLFKEKDIIYVLKPYNRSKIEKALQQAANFYQPFQARHFIPLTQYRK